MSGAVIENLSNRKLFTIFFLLSLALIGFFLVGAIVSPAPSTHMTFLMTLCEDPKRGTGTDWFYIQPRDTGCRIINTDIGPAALQSYDASQLVLVAQMPHIRDGIQLEYSPWFQSILGLLMVEFKYDSRLAQQMDTNLDMYMEVRMAYRTNDDKETEWHEFVNTQITRNLDCFIEKPEDGRSYSCAPIELFELGSSDYPYYLLNIRIPTCNMTGEQRNCKLGKLGDVSVIAIHQNGGFTIVWLVMKTLLAPLMFMCVWWYWRRVSALPRAPVLLEKGIMALGITMFMLDVPIEWLSLVFRMPFMLLLSDIRQGLFYLILFGFWLIFTGEHLIEDAGRNSLWYYWRHLSFVLFACTCMFVFDMCERGVHLRNPFYSIWSTHFGTNFAYAFIILASISVGIYFIFLAYKVVRVIATIKRKRASLAHMAVNRRLKFEAIIYRFRFLMVLTIVCAGLTAAGLMMEQIGEGQLRWGDWDDAPQMNTTSAVLTGIFGLWNVYVMLLLAMYAPSHKHYDTAQRLPAIPDDETEEDYLFSNNWDSRTENAEMTTFMKPNTD